MPFLKLLCVLLFLISTSLLSILLPFKAAGYSRDFIKEEIAKTGIYEVFGEMIIKNTKAGLLTDDSAKSEVKIVDEMLGEFNQDYLKLKSEQFIDDTSFWITGKTSTPPVISFVDIKEKIIKKNPQIITAIKEIEEESKKAELSTDSKELTADDQTFDRQNFSDFATLLKKDPVIKVGNNLMFLKSIYLIYKYGFMALIALALLSILAVYFLSGQNRMRAVAWCLAAAVAGQGITLGAVWLFYKTDPLPVMFSRFVGVNSDQKVIGLKIIDLVHNIALPWFNTYFKIQITTLAVIIILAAVFYLLGQRQSQVKPITRKSR